MKPERARFASLACIQERGRNVKRSPDSLGQDKRFCERSKRPNNYICKTEQALAIDDDKSDSGL